MDIIINSMVSKSSATSNNSSNSLKSDLYWLNVIKLLIKLKRTPQTKNQTTKFLLVNLKVTELVYLDLGQKQHFFSLILLIKPVKCMFLW